MFMTVLRTVIIYIALISVIRLMGKRQIGQMEPSELVVTMLVADLAAGPIQEDGLTVWGALIAIGVILVLEMLLSTLSLHSIFWRKLLCGKPVILIENGRILYKNMHGTRVTMDELIGYLRQKDVLDISTVQYAILETGGSLSVFCYPQEMPASAKDAGITTQAQCLPVTVISDGHLLRENLHRTGKDQRWLQKQLVQHKTTMAQTLLMTVDGQDRVVCIKKSRKREK